MNNEKLHSAPPEPGSGTGLTKEELAWNVAADSEAKQHRDRKRRVGERVVSYAMYPTQDSHESYEKNPDMDKSLDALFRDLKKEWKLSAKDIEDLFGIAKNKKGGYRLKRPNAEHLPGALDNSDFMKAILVHARLAETQVERWQVARDVFDYLGIDVGVPQAPEEEELERAGGILMWLQKKAPKALRAAPFLFLLLGGNGEREHEAQASAKVAGSMKASEGESATYLMKGETLGTLAEDLLKTSGVKKPKDQQMWDVIKVLARGNNVAVPELGVKGGVFDDDKLPVGFPVDVEDARLLAQKMAKMSESKY